MHNRNLMRKTTSYIVALFSALVLFSSCKKEYETLEQLDNKNIKAYQDANSGLVFKDTAGYSYSITSPGTGSVVNNSDSIFYAYAFKSLAGKVYNQTNDLMIAGAYLGYTDQFLVGKATYSFKPIREVLSKLKRGGKATLLLPSRMAFGKNGLPAFGISSNETILVELTVYTFQKKHEVDAFEIPTFITRNNLTFLTDPSGIRYQIIAAGTGVENIGNYSSLVCTYTGRYLDGTVFDAGVDVSFRLDQLIKGWQVILPGKIKAGGKIRIIIPSHLGYGARPLDFDIEVKTITND